MYTAAFPLDLASEILVRVSNNQLFSFHGISFFFESWLYKRVVGYFEDKFSSSNLSMFKTFFFFTRMNF